MQADKTASRSLLPKPVSPAIHITWGLVCMGLIFHGQLPIIAVMYIALGCHVALVLLAADNVTSYPNLNLVLVLGLLEFFLTCYCVTQSESIGRLLMQGVYIAVTQTLVHVIYLVTSSDHVTHRIRLGEGKGREKIKQAALS